MITIEIVDRSGDGLAPEGIFFEARTDGFEVPQRLLPTEYDPSFHDLRYHWVITRDGAAPVARQSQRLRNLPLVHNDTNTAFGKRIGHVFTEPGRYLVTCIVRDSDGLEALASLPVTIDDPETAFPGPLTILVDPSGRGDRDYIGAPIVGDPLTAAALAAEQSAPVRILLARGQVFETPRIAFGQRHHGLWLGAFGPENRPPPVLTKTTTEDDVILIGSRYQGMVRISGITFRGPWDSTRETGLRVNAIGYHWRETPHYTVITDCDFDGWNMAVYCPPDKERTGVPLSTYLHDCTITNWGDYGVYVPDQPAGHLSITACTIAQHEEARMGGPKQAPFNHHGPIRISWTGRVYMAACDLFSRNGWSANDGRPSDQPCIRWNSSMREGTSGVIERVAMEGGEVNFVASNAGVEPNHYLSNLLVEKCLIVGSSTTHLHVLTHTNGLTLRNLLAIKPNRPAVTSQWHGFAHCLHHDNFNFLDPDAPIRVYSNTIVTLLDDENRQNRDLRAVWGIEEFEVFSNENNVLIAPNTAHPRAEDPGASPREIETIAGVWRSRYQGVRYGPSTITGGAAQLEMDRRFATPNDGSVGFYIPAPSSAISRTAMGTVAIDDFFGRIRQDPESRGAFEPES